MKILKISLPLLFLSLFLVFSCKKKDSTPEPAATTTGSSSSWPTYYGVLSSSQFDLVMSGTISSTGAQNTAYFSTSPIYNSSSMSEGVISPLNAGTVSLNSTIFKASNQSGSIFYQDTTSTLFSSSYVWSVSGAAGVPAINYTYTAARPSYTGWAALQDTIKLSQTNVINLTGITGADEIVVTLYGTATLQRNLPGNATSVTLTSADLSSMSTTTAGNIIVSCFKNTYQSFGGKDYKFKAGYELFKFAVMQ